MNDEREQIEAERDEAIAQGVEDVLSHMERMGQAKIDELAIKLRLTKREKATFKGDVVELLREGQLFS